MPNPKSLEVEVDHTVFDKIFDGGIPAVSAYLHQALMVAGGIPAERTISQFKLPGIQLSWTPTGLLIKHHGKRITVPAANVANVLH